jgi:hypothetical protein
MCEGSEAIVFSIDTPDLDDKTCPNTLPRKRRCTVDTDRLGVHVVLDLGLPFPGPAPAPYNVVHAGIAHACRNDR